MTSVELKEKIIAVVNSISDESILAEIYQLLQLEKTGEYKLTEKEELAVNEGIEDVNRGRVFTSHEANSLIKEWLKK